MKRETRNVKESNERLEGGKQREKCYNYNIVSKIIKSKNIHTPSPPTSCPKRKPFVCDSLPCVHIRASVECIKFLMPRSNLKPVISETLARLLSSSGNIFFLFLVATWWVVLPLNLWHVLFFVKGSEGRCYALYYDEQLGILACHRV